MEYKMDIDKELSITNEGERITLRLFTYEHRDEGYCSELYVYKYRIDDNEITHRKIICFPGEYNYNEDDKEEIIETLNKNKVSSVDIKIIGLFLDDVKEFLDARWEN